MSVLLPKLGSLGTTRRLGRLSSHITLPRRCRFHQLARPHRPLPRALRLRSSTLVPNERGLEPSSFGPLFIMASREIAYENKTSHKLSAYQRYKAYGGWVYR